MNEFKTIQKKFKCDLTNKIATIDCTYQAVSGIGSDEVSYVPSKRKCQTDRQCAVSGLYDNCPLKGIPFE